MFSINTRYRCQHKAHKSAESLIFCLLVLRTSLFPSHCLPLCLSLCTNICFNCSRANIIFTHSFIVLRLQFTFGAKIYYNYCALGVRLWLSFSFFSYEQCSATSTRLLFARKFNKIKSHWLLFSMQISLYAQKLTAFIYFDYSKMAPFFSQKEKNPKFEAEKNRTAEVQNQS